MNEVATLVQLALGLLVFATLIAYLLTKIPKQYRLKLVLIPATLILALYMGLTIPQLLGYAYPGQPQGKFTYVSHTVNKNGKVTLVTKDGKGNFRLYEFTPGPGTLDQLAKAQGMAQKGQTVTGKFKGKVDRFGFPGLFPTSSPLEIKSPPNYGMLPPKNPGSAPTPQAQP